MAIITWAKSWQTGQSGLNQGKTTVLEHDMKYKEIGLNNTDAQFIEARKFQVTCTNCNLREVCLPGGFWWALDPTNDCEAGERHVKVAIGRDYLDCTPTRGVFKGTRTERLEVSVTMLRQIAGPSAR